MGNSRERNAASTDHCRTSKIDQFHSVVGPNHNVLRPKVAMEYSVSFHVIQYFTDFQSNSDIPFNGERLLELQQLPQKLAIEVLAYDVGPAVTSLDQLQ